MLEKAPVIPTEQRDEESQTSAEALTVEISRVSAILCNREIV